MELWKVCGGRQCRLDSEPVDESFWDGQGVEIEAKPFFKIPVWHDMSTCHDRMACHDMMSVHGQECTYTWVRLNGRSLCIPTIGLDTISLPQSSHDHPTASPVLPRSPAHNKENSGGDAPCQTSKHETTSHRFPRSLLPDPFSAPCHEKNIHVFLRKNTRPTEVVNRVVFGMACCVKNTQILEVF